MKRTLLTLALVLIAVQAWSQCANPTYQGFGSSTPGGSGQTVVTVTNGNSDGPGSLQAAIGSNRCIQFSGAYTIDNTGGFGINIDNVHHMTIDGLSAPSPGITVLGCGFRFADFSNNIIMRGIRVRQNANECVDVERKALQFLGGAHTIVIDHNSFSGSADENISMSDPPGDGPHDITISWNFFTDPVQTEGDRVNVSFGHFALRVSGHHNYTKTGDRNPAAGYAYTPAPEIQLDWRNNVGCLDGIGAMILNGTKINVINNTYINCGLTPAEFSEQVLLLDNIEGAPFPEAYVDGNTTDPNVAGLNSRGNVGSPFATAPVTTSSAAQSACDVVGGAGVLPRDSHDQGALAAFTLAGCGAPTCVPENCANGCCGDSCCAPTPSGNIARYQFENNALDTGVLGLGLHGTLNGNASFTSVNPILGTHSLLLDGTGDYVTIPVSAPWNVGQYVGLAAGVNLTGIGADGCGVIGTGSYRLGVAANGRPFAAYSDGTTFSQVEATTPLSLNVYGHLAMTVDPTHLRLWVNGTPAASTPRNGNVSDPSGFVYIGRRGGGENTADCAGRIDAVYVHNTFYDDQAVLNLYNDHNPLMGTTSTDWRFYAADAPNNTYLAGQPVNAPSIVVNRSSKLRQGWNIKRNGPTTTLHYPFECNLNGGAFAQLDNSCAANPACITTDTVKNMGDLTTEDPEMPTGGFTFVAGRHVADTINTGFQTTLQDGEVTKWDYTLAYNQSLANNDVVTCRPRTASGVLDSYPPVLPQMIMSVIAAPSGAHVVGGTFRGGTRK
jgi:hypothetical protein